jgi:hypothetical protein
MREGSLRKHHVLGFFFWITLLMCLSLSNVHATEDPTFELTVAQGDSLSNLCEKYLENSEVWPEIAKLNSLKDPDRIYPGQRLLIPVRLLRGIPLICEVTFLKGDVRVQKESMGPWSPLRKGDRITQGDSVQTGHESTTELTFEDGDSFFLQPDTFLKVEIAQEKGLVHILKEFFMDVGRILIRIREATGTDSRRKVRTPSATASARGTEFRVSVDSEGSTRSEVLKGTIEVEAMHQRVELQEEEGTWVKKGEAPQSPRRLLPPPMPFDLKPMYTQIPLQIAFEQIKDSPQSRAMVAIDRDHKDILLEKVIRTGETMDISGLQDGAYYLFTQSIDGLGLEGPSSEPFVLKVRVNPLPPFIQLPRDNIELRERSIEIRWLKVEDAASYRIQVAEDPEFAILREEKAGVREESYKTGELDYKTYYFRVRSGAADGYEGNWSSVGRFVVIPPPSSPRLEKPEVDKKIIRLRWSPSEEGTSYHLQLARDDAFKTILVDQKTPGSSMDLEKPDVPGIYYVRVSGMDADGNEGEFSTPEKVEIKEKAPYAVLGVGVGILVTIGLIILLAL